MLLPVHDAMEAMQIMQVIGYNRPTIDYYLKMRWNKITGLISEEEMRIFYRTEARTFLKGYRAFRHTNPTLAASQLRRYNACKDELK